MLFHIAHINVEKRICGIQINLLVANPVCTTKIFSQWLCSLLITIEFINFTSKMSWESDCYLSGPEAILSLNALPADLLFFEATA